MEHGIKAHDGVQRDRLIRAGRNTTESILISSLFLKVLVSAVLSGLLSCAAPFLERAKDPPGWSVCVGAEGMMTDVAGMLWDEEYPRHIRTLAPFASVRKTFGDRFSLGLKGSYGWGLDDGFSDIPIRPYMHYAHYSGLLAAKYRVFDRGAFKLEAGWESEGPVLDLSYLHDLWSFMTLSARVGYPDFVGIGLSLHPNLTNRLALHAAASNAMFDANWGAGVGLEWHQPDRK